MVNSITAVVTKGVIVKMYDKKLIVIQIRIYNDILKKNSLFVTAFFLFKTSAATTNNKGILIVQLNKTDEPLVINTSNDTIDKLISLAIIETTYKNLLFTPYSTLTLIKYFIILYGSQNKTIETGND